MDAEGKCMSSSSVLPSSRSHIWRIRTPGSEIYEEFFRIFDFFLKKKSV